MNWPHPLHRDAEGWPLHQFVVYQGAKDAPSGFGFVVRRWSIQRGTPAPEAHEAFPAKTLDEARELVPEGYVCIQPQQADDPCILEVWL